MTDTPRPGALGRLAGRGVVGGALMGLANLVPGISGGTMLLAAGVYPEFIRAIAEVTTLRLRSTSILLLSAVVGAAGLAILLFAGPVKDLVVDHRWIMYSLFIGLTLGGVPIVWSLLGRADRSARVGIGIGFVGMAALGWAQAVGAASGGASEGTGAMLLSGVAGASAMILPGVSGGYLLLVLGSYVPILSGIDAFKEALKSADLAAAVDPVLAVVLPVGIGVVVGVAVVSNALRWFLDRHRSLTLGVLLGLLVGAVVGLYPFQEGVAPQPGEVHKGRVLTAQQAQQIAPEDWPTQVFAPSVPQVGGSLVLILGGLVVTTGIRRLGEHDAGSDR